MMHISRRLGTLFLTLLCCVLALTPPLFAQSDPAPSAEKVPAPEQAPVPEQAPTLEQAPALDQVDALKSLLLLKQTRASEARALMPSLRSKRDQLIGASGLLESQIVEVGGRGRRARKQRRVLVSLLGRLSVEQATVSAKFEASQATVVLEDAAVSAVEVKLGVLAKISADADGEARQRELELQAQREKEELKLKELERIKASKETQDALADLERAQGEEIARVNQTRLEAAQRIEALTLEDAQLKTQQQELLDATRTLHSTFVEEVNSLIARTTLPVSVKASKKEVDPRFVQARQRLREVSSLYKATRAKLSELAQSIKSFEKQELDVADETTRIMQRLTEASTPLLLARQKMASTQGRRIQIELAQLKREQMNQTELRDFARRHIKVYKHLIEKLLPRISPSQKSAFYSLSSSQNWQDAREQMRLGSLLLVTKMRSYAEKVFALPSDWSGSLFWIFGLLWRIGLFFLCVRLVRKQSERAARRVLDSLLRRPWFKRQPTLTIRGVEALTFLAGPTLWFVGLYLIIHYIMVLVPEIQLLLIVVKAVYIMRALTVTATILVLPKSIRSKRAKDGLDLFDERDTSQGKDAVFSLEVSRARKLVRSIKIVVWFVLCVVYLPPIVVSFMGHSVLWHVVDLATKWFLVGVIYFVLMTWKDDIAALFERFAKDRLDSAVTFVNQNKDRPWGVLVIGIASLYVVVRAVMEIVREYILSRDLAKQINNFIFRKKIELQQREQLKKNYEVEQPRVLPEAYTDLFTLKVCEPTDPYHLPRTKYLFPIIEAYAKIDEHKRGSIAIYGEPGVGKTSILRDLESQMREAVEGSVVNVVSLTVFTKITSRQGVFRLLKRLFRLGEGIRTKGQLINGINKRARRIIIVDDCHNMFLRQIGGFAAMELFLEVVNLTDSQHAWVLAFDRFSWMYLSRVRKRDHHFGRVLEIEAWTEEELTELIQMRNNTSGLNMSFSELVVTHESATDDGFNYEVIKSSKGYFRLLHEFSKGNPRVALIYWLRSLKLSEDGESMQVTLFHKPSEAIAQGLPDNYWFALTSIAQHGSLGAPEMARIINADIGFCVAAINYFYEVGAVSLDGRRRARLKPLHMRQMLKYMLDSNYLYD